MRGILAASAMTTPITIFVAGLRARAARPRQLLWPGLRSPRPGVAGLDEPDPDGTLELEGRPATHGLRTQITPFALSSAISLSV